MRRALQAGTGRTLATIFAVIAGASFVAYVWASLGQRILDTGPKVAFIAAAFSVTAYNLRTRVVDLILKFEGTPDRIELLSGIAKSCGRKLTNLVLFFTLTALVMGSMSFLKADGSLGMPVAAGALGLFLGSCIQFVYVLFAFERLERFMLDDAEERARQKEKARLLEVPEDKAD